MRKYFTGLAVMLFTASIGWSASHNGNYVTPIQGDIGVFAKNAATSVEKPVSLAKTGEWLLVMEVKGDRIKVRDMKGMIGWVQRAEVREVASAEYMTFKSAEVYSYLDNPAPLYIIDATDPENNPIKLERSFSRELRENIDQPTVARILGVNKPAL
jgi:hypothetical protein